MKKSSVSSVPILAQDLSRSKRTWWQSQTTYFTVSFWSPDPSVCNPAFSVFVHPLSFWWLPVVQVTMHCTLPCPGRRLYLRMLVLLMVLVTTSMEWAPAPEVLWTKNSMPFSLNLYTSKRRSLKFLLSRHGCPVWIHISRKHLEISRVDLQRWIRISVPSLHVCGNSRHVLPQHQMFPVRQDPCLRSNTLTAPKPQGPMAQCHLMTIETRRRLDPSLWTISQRSYTVDRYPLGWIWYFGMWQTY